MRRLTERQKEVLYLAETCRWPTHRIAAHLGVSKRAVYSIKARIRVRQPIEPRPSVVKCRIIRPGSLMGAWGT